MGFQGFGLGETKTRKSYGEWIGPGNHRLELTKFKQVKGDAFAEFKVLATRDRGPNKTAHVPGQDVSVKFSVGGTGKQAEMAMVDMKTFLVAVVESAGGNPLSLPAAKWDEIPDDMLLGAADGVIVDCGAYNPTDKKTGEVIQFTRYVWTKVDTSPKKPDLFKGFGFATGAKAAPATTAATASAPPATTPATTPAAHPARPPGRPAARPPVDPKKKAEVLDALHEWHRDGLSREQVEDESGDYHPWAVALVGGPTYAELVGQVFDMPAGM